MKVGEFLNTLAGQAGIAADDAELKAILSSPTFSDTNISDALAAKIQGGFLTLESAKQNPDIKKHFTALALNGLDTEVETLMNDLGLTDDIKKSIKEEKSSYKRVGLLTKKIKELEAAKVGQSDEDKTKLNDKIRELNDELRTTKESFAKKEQELHGEMANQYINWELTSKFNGYDYAMPLSKEANMVAARTLLNEELKAKGLRIVNKDNKLELETKEGTEYYDATNKKVGVGDFVDGLMAHHKMLKVQDTGNNGKGGKGNPNGGANGGGGGGQNHKAGSFNAKLDAAEEAAQFDFKQ